MNMGALIEPSRSEACRRLSLFLPKAGSAYGEWRNYDLGPENRGNVSLLSPYLRRRLILEKEVIRKVLQEHSWSSAQPFIQEVFWRTYWKGWLEMRPQIWTHYQQDLKTLQDEFQSREAYVAACEGRTGIPVFDTWVRELIREGYLHNHTRMWFASIWIFTLKLPWQLGAQFFFRHLFDGDPASNTLGWRWVAGIQTPGKHYVATRQNIQKFTRSRFAPEGLAENPPPRQQEENRDFQAIPPNPSPPDPGGKRWGLLIMPEDLFPEGSPLSHIQFESIFAGLPLDLYREHQIAEPVARFTQLALRDSLDRARHHWDCPTTEAGWVRNWESAVIRWAEDHSLDGILALEAPVGPWKDLLPFLRQELNSRGLPFTQVRRDWDQLLYPLATRGFFAFKKEIPSLVQELGID